MRKISAEPYRDIDFTGARRGPLRAPPAGKTKISIRLDTVVLDHFRRQANEAGGGNYQTMINDALLAQIQRGTLVVELRRVVREELRRVLGAANGGSAVLRSKTPTSRSAASKPMTRIR